MLEEQLAEFEKQVDMLIDYAVKLDENYARSRQETEQLKKDLKSREKSDSVNALQAENRKLKQDHQLVLLKLKEMLSQIEELEKTM